MSNRSKSQRRRASFQSDDIPHSKADPSTTLKSKYISELQQRNRRLKIQIIRIRQQLSDQSQRQQVKKQHKLIPIGDSSTTIKQELENAYKQISNYERQIARLKDRVQGGMVAQKVARFENIMKEKNKHIAKLKAELSVLSKNQAGHIRQLKDNAAKVSNQEELLKLQEEIRFLREKVKESQAWEKRKQDNAKKQYDFIKKLEKFLIENYEVSTDQLEEMKRNNFYSLILQRASDSTSASNKPTPKKSTNDEQQHVSLEEYHQVRNEIKIKRKLQSDYEKRLEGLLKEKDDHDKKTVESRMKLIEKENEIEELEQLIKELKKKVKKSNMRPGIISILNQSPEPQNQNQNQKSGSPDKARQLNGAIRPPLPKDPFQNHGHLKYDQKGVASQKGKKFSDRTILGRNYLTKIIAVKLWTDKTTLSLCGLQCTYKFGDITKIGGQHVMKGKDNCIQNLYELTDGDYLKSISGSLSQDNIIEYLVLISARAQIARFGIINPSQQQFNFDIDQTEMPVCVYGSLVVRNVQPNVTSNKNPLSAVEFLGFEIVRDDVPKREDEESI